MTTKEGGGYGKDDGDRDNGPQNEGPHAAGENGCTEQGYRFDPGRKRHWQRTAGKHGSRKQHSFFTSISLRLTAPRFPKTYWSRELFGYERGAFTGAVSSKAGKFEFANGGTLLLDEISEMDIRLQAKLLRVIQEGEVDRIGGRKPVPVDVRIIATTNRNLADCVKEGTFREDLVLSLERGQRERSAT